MDILNNLGLTGTLHCIKPVAGGTMGKYVFQKTRAGHGNIAGDVTRTLQVRRWVKGSNPRTPGQQVNRAAFATAVLAWHALSGEQRAALKHKSVGTNMNAYQLFLKQQMQAFHLE
jgi:hypothetical protein